MLEKNSAQCRRILSIAAASLLAGSTALGAVRLPTLVGNGMVLQRDAQVNVWGWAEPGERVRVDFQGKAFKTQANRAGRWSVSLGPYAAGGPFDMTVSGTNTLTLRDILIGDVWLASGQSNMEFPLKPGGDWRRGVNNADQEAATAHFPGIRLFGLDNEISAMPRVDVNSKGWQAVTPESVADFSAVAYLFGRELHQRYEVPIGLIESDWGGTVAEAWVSEMGLQRFPEFNSAIRSLPETVDSHDYDLYVQQRADWYRQHGSEDRGRISGRAAWADPELDVSEWPAVSVPRPVHSCGADLNGFGGVVWFRRVLNVPPEYAGTEIPLHLGRLVQDDVTYFNGEKVGETRGIMNVRDYVAPAKYVRAGANVIAIRLTGHNDPNKGCTGMYMEDQLTAQIGATTVSLAGEWSYQPGPDLSEFPEPNAAVVARRSLPNVPTALFNGMVNPLLPFRIKGVIWYQGESNALDNRAQQYRALFPALIEDWRRHWGYDFPFLFVQLAGFGHNDSQPAEYPWAELREAQSMALTLPGTGMVTTIDIGEENDIHPRNKQDVAHRLALAAAKVAYGESIVYSGPTYQSAKIEGDSIRIEFSNLGSGLQIKDKYGYVRGFEIAGPDGKFFWARARQDGDDILVFSEAVQQPVAVRYGWSNTPDGNVYNREDLPAVPFRTDAPKR